MTDFDPEAPLSRIKGESKKAHSAFMGYFLAGAARTLRDLHQKYQTQSDRYEQQEIEGDEGEQQDNNEPATEKPPTTSWWTVGNWSKNNHWQARIAQQVANDNAIALEEYRRRHMSKEEVIARLSAMARGDMGDFAAVRAQADLADHPKSELVKKIVQHYTQTTRGQGKNEQTEIKARIALDLHDAQKALEDLAKIYGLFEKETGSSEEKPLVIKVIKGVSMDDL